MRKISNEAGVGRGREGAIERRCALEQTVLDIVRVSSCWFVLLALCREVAMLILLATRLYLLCNFEDDVYDV